MCVHHAQVLYVCLVICVSAGTWWWFLVILIIRVADTHPCVTISPSFGGATQSERNVVVCHLWEIECLLNDNHQKGKMMIMIMKTSGSQVDSPVVEGKRTEGGGRKMRDLHRDT